jgi:hypothetical protein
MLAAHPCHIRAALAGVEQQRERQRARRLHVSTSQADRDGVLHQGVQSFAQPVRRLGLRSSRRQQPHNMFRL